MKVPNNPDLCKTGPGSLAATYCKGGCGYAYVRRPICMRIGARPGIRTRGVAPGSSGRSTVDRVRVRLPGVRGHGRPGRGHGCPSRHGHQHGRTRRGAGEFGPGVAPGTGAPLSRGARSHARAPAQLRVRLILLGLRPGWLWNNNSLSQLIYVWLI